MESSDPFQYPLPSLPPLDEAFQRERSGKPRPVGIAHPLKQTSEPPTETIDTSKLTLKSLPVDSKPSRPEFVVSSADLTQDILSKDDSSDGSFEYKFTPPKQSEPLNSFKPPREGVMEARTRGCHVFVTHSTSDRQWVRETIIIPLRDPPDRKNTFASYHFMPDETRYNDTEILAIMKDSYVVLVALSDSYIRSKR